ncbi:hypothetical protein GX50_02468 [[Emmonsia] crescens]|uniref:Uncharacterized protein n=1 Tax=[Emmonsia] crescens TaxID=73230 RepID=A0A2B7ZN01_9EURO|nr:hypothetical protein GX50_02468 [Emmonsia crescens]
MAADAPMEQWTQESSSTGVQLSEPFLTVSPPPSGEVSDSLSTRRHRSSSRTKILAPQEYARAVRGYSRLRSGAGQNHIALGEFLTTEPPSSFNITIGTDQVNKSFVTLYRLGSPDHARRKHEHASSNEGEQGNQSSRGNKAHHFKDPQTLYDFSRPCLDKPQSCIVFLRGYMTPAWLNNIGAKYVVDPEFFCRHLDFRPPDDNSNNFSIPALPSSSWHLIELPLLTIGTRDIPKGPTRPDIIEDLRTKGSCALAEHHHRISRLSSSGMSVGDSLVRDFHVFDETHFAIEQRVSICMQEAGHAFSLLIWLDSGKDFNESSGGPWSPAPPESRLLPVIRHKPMVALKCHLLSDETYTPQTQSASLLHVDYGRSLRSSIMAADPFYALNEIFSFAASSEMYFLNLIDIKLDKYTGPNIHEPDSLPNLKYTKDILYRHIQKIQRILNSIHNAQHFKWPRAGSEGGRKGRATTAAEGLEQDFSHLLNCAQTLHTRCNEAITVLMSSISISESTKAIDQGRRVAKLTFLAFIFVPLSFTTSFFGMNVKEFEANNPPIYYWVACSILVMIMAFLLLAYDITLPFRILYRYIRTGFC